MPNRIIKESICTSENIDALTEFQEIFFYRLMVNCDDYGRFDARAKLISSRLFPLKSVSIEMVESALTALQENDLIFLYKVDGHPYLQMKTWDKHQQTRATKSKYPSPEEGEKISSDNNGNQLISDDDKCPRNRIRNTLFVNRESLSSSESGMIADDEAHAIQHEHDQVLEAAKSAGFKCTDSEIAELLRLYADNGLDKMLHGFTACVDHSAPNLAYLRAVLSGKPKEKPPGRVVPAQDFPQRNYKSVNDELMDSTAKEVEEFLAKEVG